MDIPSISLTSGSLFAAGLFILWLALIAIRRRFSHPLATIPGPFLAAVTSLYGFYYNAIKGGVLYLQIEHLHEIYGPLVRIGPNEIHLSDPGNYEAIYSIGSRFYKHREFYAALGDQSIFAISSNEAHRQHRALLNPFFSRKHVLELEELVQEKVAKLCRLLTMRTEEGEAMDLHAGFRAISVDVLTDYAFDDCWDQLDREDLGAWFTTMMKSTGAVFWTFQQFPFLRIVVASLPQRLARRLSSNVNDLLDVKAKIQRAVQSVQNNMNEGVTPRRPTIFYELLNPELNPTKQPPQTEVIVDEAWGICVAASDTTGNAMTVATYHAITNPEIQEALKRELRSRFPDPNQQLTYTELEKLPYLTGVVKEGLRLSYGTVSRLPRVTPPGGATFNGYVFPEGTVVGMSSYMMHRNEHVFPDPTTFDPDRWISGDPEVIKLREKNLVPFSRGQRMCIGQNLAMCEIYVTLGTLFRRFEHLTAPDVGPLTYVDYFIIHHPDDSQKLRVSALVPGNTLA